MTSCIKLETFLLLLCLFVLHVYQHVRHRDQEGTHHVSISVVCPCVHVHACVRACSVFHVDLSHPLRKGRGRMLSEPECPSFLRGPALTGIKTKTTGFHSMKQLTGSLLRDLPLQSIEFSGQLAGKHKPKAPMLLSLGNENLKECFWQHII